MSTLNWPCKIAEIRENLPKQKHSKGCQWGFSCHWWLLDYCMRFETRHEEPPTADSLPIPDLSGPCVLKRVIRTVEQLGVRISSGKVAQITGRRQGIWIVLGHVKDLLAKKLDRAWVEDALSNCRSNCQTRPVYGGSKNWTLSRHTVPKTNENVVSLFFHKKWVRGVNGKAPRPWSWSAIAGSPI